MHTFGSERTNPKKYDVVQFTDRHSSDLEKKITTEALLTEFISGSPVKISPNKIEKTLEIKNVQLSNVSESFERELGLLIGAQYFLDIHSGEKKRLNKSLLLTDTLFGKVVQGRISTSDLNYK